MGTWHPRMAIPALSDPLGGAGHNAPYRPEGTVLSLCPPWGSAKSPCPSVPCHVPAVHLCRPSSDDWLAPWGQGPLEQTWQLPSHESKLAAGIQLLGAPSLPWAGLGS